MLPPRHALSYRDAGPLTWDQNYGANYLRPTGILMRFLRFNVTFDF